MCDYRSLHAGLLEPTVEDHQLHSKSAGERCATLSGLPSTVFPKLSAKTKSNEEVTIYPGEIEAESRLVLGVLPQGCGARKGITHDENPS